MKAHHFFPSRAFGAYDVARCTECGKPPEAHPNDGICAHCGKRAHVTLNGKPLGCGWLECHAHKQPTWHPPPYCKGGYPPPRLVPDKLVLETIQCVVDSLFGVEHERQ